MESKNISKIVTGIILLLLLIWAITCFNKCSKLKEKENKEKDSTSGTNNGNLKGNDNVEENSINSILITQTIPNIKTLPSL